MVPSGVLRPDSARRAGGEARGGPTCEFDVGLLGQPTHADGSDHGTRNDDLSLPATFFSEYTTMLDAALDDPHTSPQAKEIAQRLGPMYQECKAHMLEFEQFRRMVQADTEARKQQIAAAGAMLSSGEDFVENCYLQQQLPQQQCQNEQQTQQQRVADEVGRGRQRNLR